MKIGAAVHCGPDQDLCFLLKMLPWGSRSDGCQVILLEQEKSKIFKATRTKRTCKRKKSKKFEHRLEVNDKKVSLLENALHEENWTHDLTATGVKSSSRKLCGKSRTLTTAGTWQKKEMEERVRKKKQKIKGETEKRKQREGWVREENGKGEQ